MPFMPVGIIRRAAIVILILPALGNSQILMFFKGRIQETVSSRGCEYTRICI